MLRLNDFSNKFINQSCFRANVGEVTAIIGPNGSGKTSLAKYIAGIYEDYEGEIIINGQVVNTIASEVALLLQNPYHQFVGLEVFDEVTYNLEQQNMDHELIKANLEKIPFALDKTLLELSGGEAQSLLVYNYLMSNKKVFIFDETFSNMDYDLKVKLFKKIKAANKIIILITNNIFDLQFADVSYQLQNKKLVKQEVELPTIGHLNNNNPIALHVTSNKTYKFKTGFNILRGKSASGKTTLVKQVCGINSSKICVEPKDYEYFYLDQYPFIQITNLKVKELYKNSPESLELLELIGFNKEIYQRDIVSLSTGELVQIMIVKALLSTKQVLCFDESIEVLDYQKQQQILNICSKYSERIFIFITHNPEIFSGYEINEVYIDEGN